MLHSSDPQDARDDIPAYWRVISFTPDSGVCDYILKLEYTEEEWSDQWEDILYAELIKTLAEDELPAINKDQCKFYHYKDEYYCCGNRVVIKSEFSEFADIEEGWYEQ